METIRNFKDLIAHLAQREERKKMAVVWAADANSQGSVFLALEKEFVDVIFVGCKEEIEKHEKYAQYADHITFVDATDRDDAARVAVQLVREHKADILMKGLINTDNLLHAVLNKETGILPRGNVLTHITAGSIPHYPKLLLFSDPAVIPYPNQQQRVEQVRYMANLCHALGVAEPKIALNHCTEKVGEKFFPFTVGYKEIIDQAKAGEFGACIVDGPLDLKTSICEESMRIKGIESPINGEADAVIFPDIEAANVFYKTISFFPGVETAAILQGAMAPVVLPSRSDSKATKLNSIALASI